MERALVRTDRADPHPAELKAYMAQVFASLDERPRALLLDIDVANERGASVSIDLVDGEPVFIVDGHKGVKANFRRRWLAEHPVPLVLRRGRCRLVLEPTTRNRVRVRLPTIAEIIFPLARKA